MRENYGETNDGKRKGGGYVNIPFPVWLSVVVTQKAKNLVLTFELKRCYRIVSSFGLQTLPLCLTVPKQYLAEAVLCFLFVKAPCLPIKILH